MIDDRSPQSQSHKRDEARKVNACTMLESGTFISTVFAAYYGGYNVWAAVLFLLMRSGLVQRKRAVLEYPLTTSIPTTRIFRHCTSLRTTVRNQRRVVDLFTSRRIRNALRLSV